MSENHSELHTTLSTWARTTADLLARWGFQPHDAYLASESVLVLQGYDVEPEAGWESRFELHLDDEKLPWTPSEDEAEPIVPPAEVSIPELEQAPLHFLSTRKYSLPVTFRRPHEFDDGAEVHLITPRGIARLYTVNVVWLIKEKRDPTPEERTWLEQGCERLGYLGERPWPRRDRWFSKFCAEMIDIRRKILDGNPPRPSQMVKFGRRFVVI